MNVRAIVAFTARIRAFVLALALPASIACSNGGASNAEPSAAANSTNPTDPQLIVTEQAEQPPEQRDLDVEGIAAKQAAIESEIARLGLEHPWAGEYSTHGTDTSSQLLVAPEVGYIVRNSGRKGPWISQLGSVRFESGRVALIPDPVFDPERQPYELIPVRWGERKYLLQESRIADFCNDVNSGREASMPSGARWIQCRQGGVNGRPALPAPFQTYVRDEPLNAKVLEKHSRVGAGPLIVLDVGRAHGVFEKMEFLRLPSDGSLVRVEEVFDTTCKATCRGGSWFDELPIGAVFSTQRQFE